MHQSDPAVPKVVERARVVTHRYNTIWIVAGMFAGVMGAATLSMLSVMNAGPAWDPNIWVPIVGVSGLALATGGLALAAFKAPSGAELADAKSILAAWAESRDAWAKEVIAAELSGVPADVAAHKQAADAFERMHHSRAQQAAAEGPKQL